MNLQEQIQHHIELLAKNPNPQTFFELSKLLWNIQSHKKSIEMLSYCFNYQLDDNFANLVLNLLSNRITWCMQNRQSETIQTLFNDVNQSGIITLNYLKLQIQFYQALNQKELLFNLYPIIINFEYNPQDIDFIINCALLFNEFGYIQQTLGLFNLGLKINSTHEILFEHFTNILIQNRLYEINTKIINYSIKLFPNNPNLLENLGISYFTQKEFQTAIEIFTKAIALPNVSILRQANIFNNLGTAYTEINQLDQAHTCYKKSIELNPNHDLAKMNLAGFLLLNGDYLKGFEYYESRFLVKSEEFNRLSVNVLPSWTKKSNKLKGEVILLYPEQGLGDIIQMSRYFLLLKNYNKNNNLWITCGEPLYRLIEKNFIKTGILEKIIPISNINDYQSQIKSKISIMSLPYLFQTTIETIPNANEAYLKIDDFHLCEWHNKIQNLLSNRKINSSVIKVGLAWEGSQLHQKNAIRNLNTQQIESLLKTFKNKNIIFFTIHKSNSPQIEASNLINLNDFIQDFYDLGAVIKNMDLIISVDSAPVHMAGALNHPTWTLLYTPCDWRWYINQPDSSIWYDNIKLYRQTKPNDWQDVLTRMQNDLLNYVDLISTTQKI